MWSAQGCSERPTRVPCARRGILMCVGGSHAPCAPPAPARHAQRTRAGAQVGSKGLWCGARCDTAEHDPHADGSRARSDVLRCSTCCQDPPSHAQPARRERGGFHWVARKSVAAKGVESSGTREWNRSMCAPRPSSVLGWLSWVCGAAQLDTRVPGTRESHFGGGHRISPCSIRCMCGTCPPEPHSYR